MDVMIDLETLGTSPRAPIIQVGAVAFEARDRGRVLNDKPYSMYVDPASCVRVGMTGLSGDTFAWWLTQTPEARLRIAEGLKNAVPLPFALIGIRQWLEQTVGVRWEDVEGVWGHGACFDISLLHTSYDLCQLETPWGFRKPQDTRTLFRLVGGMPTVDTGGMSFVYHDAVEDCVFQCMAVQRAMGMIRAHRG